MHTTLLAKKMKTFPLFILLAAIALVSCGRNDSVEFFFVFTEPGSGVTFRAKMPVKKGKGKTSATTYQILRECGVKFEAHYPTDGELSIRVECKKGEIIESKEIELALEQMARHTFESGVIVTIIANKPKS
jgi:hypothetical protein